MKAHLSGGAGEQPALDFRATKTHFRADGQREERIDDLVPAQKIDAVFAGNSAIPAIDIECRAVFVHANIARDAIVIVVKADSDNAGACAAGQFLAPGIVTVEKKNAVGRQHFADCAFFANDADEIVEKFEMFAANIGNDTHSRRNHPQQRLQFAGMIGAGLQHGGLMTLFQTKERQRNADVVVETGFAPKRGHFFAQHGSDQFLGRRLAIGTADGDDWEIELAAVSRRPNRPKAARVSWTAMTGHAEKSVGSLRRSATMARRSAAATSQNKGVTIEPFAGQGEKQIAGLSAARISCDSR